MRKSITVFLLVCASLQSLRAQNPDTSQPVSSPASTPAIRADDAQELPRGRIVERVAVRENPSQSYALYLPSGYTPEKRWPILYCFDPAARGALPVELFRAAAERYGWIVAGSNNSRNGSLREAWEATTAMWDDTRARLSIDARRVYAAGFSGGARTAVRLGYLCKDCLAGVVAVGAGYPAGLAPQAGVPFPLFLIAGTEDFNFPEMRLLDDALERLDATHRLELFDGGHSWPSPELCTEAVEWLELEAMKTGRRERDETLVEELWKRAATSARLREETGQPYEAFRSYRALASDFRGLRDISEPERRAAQLGETKEVRRAREEEDEQIKRQQRLVGSLHALLETQQRASDADARTDASLDFRKSIADLKRLSAETKDTGGRRVARRALRQFFAQVYEVALSLLREREEYSRPVSLLEAALEIAPDSARLHFDLARAYALKREKRKALDALRRAVEKGFDDAAELSGDPALDALRGEPGFAELLKKLSKGR
ncbi:MAG TPA: tetratricopeptide repeat protein [Pyrinomonadaceae bacterium]